MFKLNHPCFAKMARALHILYQLYGFSTNFIGVNNSARPNLRTTRRFSALTNKFAYNICIVRAPYRYRIWKRLYS